MTTLRKPLATRSASMSLTVRSNSIGQAEAAEAVGDYPSAEP
jgi:hypothetical protein